LVAGVIAFVLAAAPPAFAQDDEMRGDFAASYAFLRDSDLDINFGAGFGLALTGDISRRLHFVGEFGGSFKTFHLPVATIRVDVVSYQGGFRFGLSPEAKARPFVQMLAGGGRLKTTQVGVIGNFVTDNGFAAQAGAGVDFDITRQLDGRLQVDYRAIFTQGTLHEVRVMFGVVFPFGRD
jgi:hypothetical protein